MPPIDATVLERFLMCYCDKSRPAGEQYKYVRSLQAIQAQKTRVLTIDLDDLIAYSKNDAIFQRTNAVT